MELADSIHETQTPEQKAAAMRSGANWFYWIAALSVLNSLVVTFGGTFNFLIGLGATQLVDGLMIGMVNEGLSPMLPWAGLALNLFIAAIFALFGYYGRKGSDLAFIVGMFLYTADSLIVLGFRDFFGFAFHVLALFFMFKGLLASRKRYDLSV